MKGIDGARDAVAVVYEDKTDTINRVQDGLW